MSGPRVIGVFLVVAGVALLGVSGLRWREGRPELARIGATSAVMEDSLKHVHDRLVQESLKSRALQESQTTIPDTLRVYGAGKMMEMGNIYNKNIRKFEMNERDVKLELASLKRDAERVRATAKQRALRVGAAGAAAFVIGIILTALPKRRVGA
jgi:hypothetical protein